MSAAIVIRSQRGNVKYLDARYKWGDLPDLIPAWHMPVVLDIMLDPRNPQPPTGWAWVDDGQPIDLDALTVIPL